MCADSTQCSGGICQPTGYCSFDDADCSTGQRYGAADKLSGVCVGSDPPPPPPTCDTNQPFGPPVLVAGLESAYEDASLRLSRDELTGYFFSARAGGGLKLLFTASRTAVTVPFDPPRPLDGVSKSTAQYHPTVTDDGLYLFFASYTSDADNEIFQATRMSATDSFSSPQRVSSNINSAAPEVQPYVTRDSTAIYFVRNENTVLRALGNAKTGFMPASEVTELNGVSSDADPVPSADGLTIYWASDRTQTGNFDVWEAHRPDQTAQFSRFAPVDSVNSADFEAPTDVSADGCRLYLTITHNQKPSIYVASRPPRT